ncbi:hypothetical protein CBR_g20092 [Chara braunii]|uniref:Myb-like domain-containing protein n=1 Tax=Chara braunii TaxID=69332 RepID=A0A388KZK2_CHABU|nr:hypothetical protein CBR_g20092 [Chara braunii]|eukprot:GBG75461.1 hypothetical protein CBR_g20092 [Chara braunii]
MTRGDWDPLERLRGLLRTRAMCLDALLQPRQPLSGPHLWTDTPYVAVRMTHGGAGMAGALQPINNGSITDLGERPRGGDAGVLCSRGSDLGGTGHVSVLCTRGTDLGACRPGACTRESSDFSACTRGTDLRACTRGTDVPACTRGTDVRACTRSTDVRACTRGTDVRACTRGTDVRACTGGTDVRACTRDSNAAGRIEAAAVCTRASEADLRAGGSGSPPVVDAACTRGDPRGHGGDPRGALKVGESGARGRGDDVVVGTRGRGSDLDVGARGSGGGVDLCTRGGGADDVRTSGSGVGGQRTLGSGSLAVGAPRPVAEEQTISEAASRLFGQPCENQQSTPTGLFRNEKEKDNANASVVVVPHVPRVCGREQSNVRPVFVRKRGAGSGGGGKDRGRKDAGGVDGRRKNGGGKDGGIKNGGGKDGGIKNGGGKDGGIKNGGGKNGGGKDGGIQNGEAAHRDDVAPRGGKDGGRNNGEGKEGGGSDGGPARRDDVGPIYGLDDQEKDKNARCAMGPRGGRVAREKEETDKRMTVRKEACRDTCCDDDVAILTKPATRVDVGISVVMTRRSVRGGDLVDPSVTRTGSRQADGVEATDCPSLIGSGGESREEKGDEVAGDVADGKRVRARRIYRDRWGDYDTTVLIGLLGEERSASRGLMGGRGGGGGGGGGQEQGQSTEEEGPRANGAWHRIARAMRAEGLERTWDQCQTRWKNLRRWYRLVVNHDHSQIGCHRSYWSMNPSERCEANLNFDLRRNWFAAIGAYLGGGDLDMPRRRRPGGGSAPAPAPAPAAASQGGIGHVSGPGNSANAPRSPDLHSVRQQQQQQQQQQQHHTNVEASTFQKLPRVVTQSTGEWTHQSGGEGWRSGDGGGEGRRSGDGGGGLQALNNNGEGSSSWRKTSDDESHRRMDACHVSCSRRRRAPDDGSGDYNSSSSSVARSHNSDIRGCVEGTPSPPSISSPSRLVVVEAAGNEGRSGDCRSAGERAELVENVSGGGHYEHCEEYVEARSGDGRVSGSPLHRHPQKDDVVAATREGVDFADLACHNAEGAHDCHVSCSRIHRQHQDKVGVGDGEGRGGGCAHPDEGGRSGDDDYVAGSRMHREHHESEGGGGYGEGVSGGCTYQGDDGRSGDCCRVSYSRVHSRQHRDDIVDVGNAAGAGCACQKGEPLSNEEDGELQKSDKEGNGEPSSKEKGVLQSDKQGSEGWREKKRDENSSRREKKSEETVRWDPGYLSGCRGVKRTRSVEDYSEEGVLQSDKQGSGGGREKREKKSDENSSRREKSREDTLRSERGHVSGCGGVRRTRSVEDYSEEGVLQSDKEGSGGGREKRQKKSDENSSRREKTSEDTLRSERGHVSGCGGVRRTRSVEDHNSFGAQVDGDTVHLPPSPPSPLPYPSPKRRRGTAASDVMAAMKEEEDSSSRDLVKGETIREGEGGLKECHVSDLEQLPLKEEWAELGAAMSKDMTELRAAMTEFRAVRIWTRRTAAVGISTLELEGRGGRSPCICKDMAAELPAATSTKAMEKDSSGVVMRQQQTSEEAGGLKECHVSDLEQLPRKEEESGELPAAAVRTKAMEDDSSGAVIGEPTREGVGLKECHVSDVEQLPLKEESSGKLPAAAGRTKAMEEDSSGAVIGEPTREGVGLKECHVSDVEQFPLDKQWSEFRAALSKDMAELRAAMIAFRSGISEFCAARRWQPSFGLQGDGGRAPCSCTDMAPELRRAATSTMAMEEGSSGVVTREEPTSDVMGLKECHVSGVEQLPLKREWAELRDALREDMSELRAATAELRATCQILERCDTWHEAPAGVSVLGEEAIMYQSRV